MSIQHACFFNITRWLSLYMIDIHKRGKDNNEFFLYNINFIPKYKPIKLVHFSVDDRFQTESVFLMI